MIASCANRHRLNAVVFRRTQADACNADGEPLFARRQVHTSAFHLSPAEEKFYKALMDYLRDGYNLAAAQGSKGHQLDFVMTIFQKIASSSFAAVASTLRRAVISAASAGQKATEWIRNERGQPAP